jgi:2-(1,2-epoxy-1,2-dihydrophenyl)acetyl-CoA isomerase
VAALREAAVDPEVRAVLLLGSGGYFCVGGDVTAMAAGSGADMPPSQRAMELRDRMEASRLLHDMPKPTVACIRGAAAGAGLSIAMACDFRVASETAKITTAFAKVGLSGDFGGTYFITRLLGSARARELYLTAPVLSGVEALRLGLVTRAVADEQAESAATQLARSLADGPSVTLGYMKQNLNAAEQGSLADCLDGEALRHIQCAQTEDHKEAAAAFVGKRAPKFVGR